MASLIVFLDASVILAGLASPHGGSSLLFKAAKKKKITLITTPLVINEVNRHLIKLKVKPSLLKTLLDRRIVNLVADPPETLIKRCRRLTADPDDAHVLAGAVITSARFLLSLDKKHLVTSRTNKYLRPMRVLTPKQFWQRL